MPRGKVYVIDDDEAMRHSLEFLLGSVDFEVALFGSAQAFLDAMPSLEFGCVVSDVWSHGLRLARGLSRRPVHPALPPRTHRRVRMSAIPTRSPRLAGTPTRLAIAGAALLALAACSSPQPPAAEVAVGRASVERATAAAPEAPMEISSARDKIARANVAMANKDYATARRLAEEADADARLAEAKARASRSETALAEVREGIRQLREQTARADRP